MALIYGAVRRAGSSGSMSIRDPPCRVWCADHPLEGEFTKRVDLWSAPNSHLHLEFRHEGPPASLKYYGYGWLGPYKARNCSAIIIPHGYRTPSFL